MEPISRSPRLESPVLLPDGTEGKVLKELSQGSDLLIRLSRILSETEQDNVTLKRSSNYSLSLDKTHQFVWIKQRFFLNEKKHATHLLKWVYNSFLEKTKNEPITPPTEYINIFNKLMSMEINKSCLKDDKHLREQFFLFFHQLLFGDLIKEASDLHNYLLDIERNVNKLITFIGEGDRNIYSTLLFRSFLRALELLLDKRESVIRKVESYIVNLEPRQSNPILHQGYTDTKVEQIKKTALPAYHSMDFVLCLNVIYEQEIIGIKICKDALLDELKHIFKRTLKLLEEPQGNLPSNLEDAKILVTELANRIASKTTTR